MTREEARDDHRRRRRVQEDDNPPDPSPPEDDTGNPGAADLAGSGPADPERPDAFPASGDEQAEFLEQYDEDLYTDREERPAQGNTADVALGHRFGSDAEAYAEYAWRRPGAPHRGDASAVGQSRDPSDIADED